MKKEQPKKLVSEKLEERVVDLALDEIVGVLDGKRAMTDKSRSAFKAIGDYSKVLGAENQRRALDFAIEKRMKMLADSQGKVKAQLPG